MHFTIGLAQIAPRLGNLSANLQRHIEVIQEARAQGVDLLCFPELSLTGYTLRDQVPDLALTLEPTESVWHALFSAAGEMDVVVGFVERDRRHRFYIAAAYLSGGQILHVHRKVYLCTYTLFEEGRFLAAGDEFRAFDTRFGRIGMLICEDFWHISSPYIMWLDGADLLLMMSSSPGRGLGKGSVLGSSESVENVNRSYATFLTTYVAHCNRVGFEDGINFWGGSTVFGPDGDLVAHGPYFEEALLTATIDLAQIRRTRQRLPLLRDEKHWLVLDSLRRLHDADEVK
ncbi:MAG: carbon-nitrogen hydrolase [Chloroflexi bacterium]|nr:carbon-nitrogen hydrolase [Chloroflexota bacterium]